MKYGTTLFVTEYSIQPAELAVREVERRQRSVSHVQRTAGNLVHSSATSGPRPTCRIVKSVCRRSATVTF